MLLYTALAIAGVSDRVDRLVDRQKYDDAIQLAEDWLDVHSEDTEVAGALERAYFAKAQAINTPAAYAAFRRRYPEGERSREAFRIHAEIEWTRIRSSSDLQALTAYAETFPGGPHESEARTLLANLRFRDAQQQDTIEGWSAFIQDFPADPRAVEAQKRLEISALADARAAGDVGALQSFVETFPESPQRSVVIREILVETASLTIPGCTGGPATVDGQTIRCRQIPAGTRVSARFTAADEVSAEWMAWSRDGAVLPLGDLLFAWAGGPYEEEARRVASTLQGTVVDNGWSLTAPFPIRRPRAADVVGYVLRLSAGESRPVDLRVQVDDVWTHPTQVHDVQVVLDRHRVSVSRSPGQTPTSLATVPDLRLDVPDNRLVTWDHLVAWGDKGLVRIGLTDGTLDRVVKDRPVAGAWFAGGVLFYVIRDPRGNELHLVDRDGSRRQLPLPGGSTGAWPLAIAQSQPIVLLSTNDGFWVAQADGLARQVARADPKEYVVALEPGGTRALFLKGGTNTAQVRVSRVLGGGSHAVDMNLTSLLGSAPGYVYWGQTRWHGDRLVAELFGDSGRLALIAMKATENTVYIDVANEQIWQEAAASAHANTGISRPFQGNTFWFRKPLQAWMSQ